MTVVAAVLGTLALLIVAAVAIEAARRPVEPPDEVDEFAARLEAMRPGKVRR